MFEARLAMKMLLLLVMLFMLCGCQSSAPQLETPVSDSEAIGIAKKAAISLHVDLRNYQHVQGNIILNNWDVTWYNLNSTKGFAVTIERKTGKVVNAGEVIIHPPAPPN